MPALGIHTDTSQPAVTVETHPLIDWANGMTGSDLVTGSFTTNNSGASAGSIGASTDGMGNTYATIREISTAEIKSLANVDPLVAGATLSNIEVYAVIYNITRGTQLSLPKFNPVVPSNVNLNVLTWWKLASDTMDDSLYDDVRSPTTGPKAKIKLHQFPGSALSQTRTALDLSFTGCFSSEYEFAWYIKSIHNGKSIKGDTRRDGEGISGALISTQDITLAERAVHTGSPIFLESYVDLTFDALVPDEPAIIMEDVPIRLVSNDTFDITDKNGVKIDLTGTFEWIDVNGVNQSVTFPAVFATAGSILASVTVKTEVEAATSSSRQLVLGCAIT